MVGRGVRVAGSASWSGAWVTGEPIRADDDWPSSAGRRGVALLLDLGLLAAQVAQVVELGAADVAAGDDLDLVDDRGVQREGALDADAEGDLADREGAADAGALDADADALEDLDAGAVALDDLDVHLEGVAGAELGDVVALGGGGERVDDVGHDVSSWAPQVTHGTGMVRVVVLRRVRRAERPLWQVVRRPSSGWTSDRDATDARSKFATAGRVARNRAVRRPASDGAAACSGARRPDRGLDSGRGGSRPAGTSAGCPRCRRR